MTTTTRPTLVHESYCTDHQYDPPLEGWCEHVEDCDPYTVTLGNGTMDSSSRVLVSQNPRSRASEWLTPDEAEELAHVIERMVQAARAAANEE